MSGIGNLIIGVGTNIDGLKKGMADAVQVVTKDGKKLGDAAKAASDKITEGMKGAGTSTESMRTQLRKATQDAQRMAEQFGINSKEFRVAAATAGELKDRIGDINTVITAMSADSKFTSVANAMQAAAGSISIVTGAMGLLGVESENVQKTMLKVQSAIALTQGIAQLKEMGAAFTAMSVVIRTSVIPSLMTMSGALIATGIGALIVALGIAIASWSDYQEAVKYAANIQGIMIERTRAATDAFLKQADAMFKISSARKGGINDIDRQIKILEAQGNKENEIYVLQQKKLAMEMAYMEQKKKFAIKQGVTDEALLQMNEDIKNKENEIIVLRLSNQKRLSDSLEKNNDKTIKAAEKTADKMDEIYENQKNNALHGEQPEYDLPTPSGPAPAATIPVPMFSRAELDEASARQEELFKNSQLAIEKAKRNAAELAQLSNNINTAFVGAITEAITGWAELTGAALAGATVSFESFGMVALQAITGFMKTMANQMISLGVARIATDTLIAIPGAGPGLVAAGTGLLIAASMANTMANKSPMNGSAGVGGSGQMGGTNQRGGGSIKLAQGGIAYGPTLATIGDNKGARFNPEVVAPLDKLKNLMGGGGSSDVTVHGQLYGETILLSSRRAGQKMNRRGQRF